MEYARGRIKGSLALEMNIERATRAMSKRAKRISKRCGGAACWGTEDRTGALEVGYDAYTGAQGVKPEWMLTFAKHGDYSSGGISKP